MSENNRLLKTLEAIIDNSDLDEQEQVVLALRLAAVKLVEINSESISMKLGDYRVELKLTDEG